jgi:hypothetical protein
LSFHYADIISLRCQLAPCHYAIIDAITPLMPLRHYADYAIDIAIIDIISIDFIIDIIISIIDTLIPLD